MSEIIDLYNESYHNNFKKVVDENKQLKAENEKLKKSIKILKDTVKIQARTIDKNQSDWFNNFSKMKNKYEQCLDEIGKIAEGRCSKGTAYACTEIERIVKGVRDNE